MKVKTCVCESCRGQTGVYATCSKCMQTIERMCIKCLAIQKLACSCFDIRSTFDFVKWYNDKKSTKTKFWRKLNMSESSSTIFVLLSCIDGKTDKTIEHLQKISSIKEISSTDGLYDLVIKVESKTGDEFRQMLNHRIRSLDSVKYTMTLQTIDNM